MAQQHSEAGFTLIEVVLTVALVGGLCAISFVSLGKPQTTASLSGAVDTLVADLKSQQLLAMTGNQGGASSAQPQGIFIQSNQYTLFAGTAYDSQDEHNFTLTPGQGLSFSTTFEDSAVSFVKGSGEVEGFVDGDNTITVQKNGDSRTVTLNRFGMVTVE